MKDDRTNTSATDTRWLAFNIQRPVFADRQVREAITLAFDFEWMNKALFYGAYSRPNSYFQNTEYAARDYPKADELALLAPMKKNCRLRSLPGFISRQFPAAMVLTAPIYSKQMPY